MDLLVLFITSSGWFSGQDVIRSDLFALVTFVSASTCFGFRRTKCDFELEFETVTVKDLCFENFILTLKMFTLECGSKLVTPSLLSRIASDCSSSLLVLVTM